jgi:hypothetical protein
MKAAMAFLMILVLAGTVWSQDTGAATAPSKAEVIAAMKTSLAADGDWARLNSVPGFDKAAKADYIMDLVPQADALSGSAKTKALITIYSSIVAFGADAYGLGDRITSSVAAIADPADKALAASYVLRYPVHITMKTVALSLADTPNLPPESQRIADGLGVLKDRREPKNLIASWNLKVGDFAVRMRAWYGPSKSDLKRLLILTPVDQHASYVAAVNVWMLRARVGDVGKVSADYQTYLKDGAGGVDLLADVALPTDDGVAQAATAELQRPNLTADQRVDMLLLLGRNKEAFQDAEAAVGGVTKDITTVKPSANVHRMAKVIKAIDGNWKRATDYVNLFQPAKAGETIVDPIPDVKKGLGL